MVKQSLYDSHTNELIRFFEKKFPSGSHVLICKEVPKNAESIGVVQSVFRDKFSDKVHTVKYIDFAENKIVIYLENNWYVLPEWCTPYCKCQNLLVTGCVCSAMKRTNLKNDVEKTHPWR